METWIIWWLTGGPDGDAYVTDVSNASRAMLMDLNSLEWDPDILGVPVIRPRVTETTALGAAYAAGLGVGYWESLADLRKNWAENKAWNPGMADELRTKKYRGWQKAVERAFGWID